MKMAMDLIEDGKIKFYFSRESDEDKYFVNLANRKILRFKSHFIWITDKYYLGNIIKLKGKPNYWSHYKDVIDNSQLEDLFHFWGSEIFYDLEFGSPPSYYEESLDLVEDFDRLSYVECDGEEVLKSYFNLLDLSLTSFRYNRGYSQTRIPDIGLLMFYEYSKYSGKYHWCEGGELSFAACHNYCQVCKFLGFEGGETCGYPKRGTYIYRRLAALGKID